MSSVLDGLYMSRELSSAGKRPPVIMMTSIANTDYAELFPTDEEIDIDRFLTKPVSPDRLIEEVDALLEKK